MSMTPSRLQLDDESPTLVASVKAVAACDGQSSGEGLKCEPMADKLIQDMFLEVFSIKITLSLPDIAL